MGCNGPPGDRLAVAVCPACGDGDGDGDGDWTLSSSLRKRSTHPSTTSLSWTAGGTVARATVEILSVALGGIFPFVATPRIMPVAGGVII
jgi:hypothetical protein